MNVTKSKERKTKQESNSKIGNTERKESKKEEEHQLAIKDHV